MTNEEIYGYIDHTLLSVTSTWEQIEKLCDEAVQYHTASVCIPPCYIERVKAQFPALNVCTVIGFPNGYMTTAAKAFEAKDACLKGADEIDMVINLCMVKNGDFSGVTDEIRAVREACGGKLLKVIIETCYLSEEDKIKLCKCVTDAGAGFIKTSTGFGTGGATKADIELFKAHIGEGVKMKAAGGVKTRDDLEMYIGLGCERIGTSSAVRLLNEKGDQ